MPEIDLVKIFSTLTVGGVGIWTGVAMLAVYMLREWRETRKLSLDDRNARREGYSKQVDQLMNENRMIMEDMSKLRSEYDHYREIGRVETKQLRADVVHLEKELTGMRRNFASVQIGLARMIATIAGGNAVTTETLQGLTDILDLIKD